MLCPRYFWQQSSFYLLCSIDFLCDLKYVRWKLSPQTGTCFANHIGGIPSWKFKLPPANSQGISFFIFYASAVWFKKGQRLLASYVKHISSILHACLISAAFYSAQHFFFKKSLWKCLTVSMGVKVQTRASYEYRRHISCTTASLAHGFMGRHAVSVYILLKSASFFLNGTWASLAELQNNYCSLSRSHKGHHNDLRVTYPTWLHAANVNQVNNSPLMHAMQGQSPLNRNVQVAAWCSNLPDTQSRKMWQRSM